MKSTTLRLIWEETVNSIQTSRLVIVSLWPKNKYHITFEVSAAIKAMKDKEYEVKSYCDPSLLYTIDPQVADKVDGKLRDLAVRELLSTNKAYFQLSPLTFNLAVNLIDLFITKVRVKPKYIHCVATAAYCMAAEMCELQEDVPNREELVNITRCGGTSADLQRMIDIIRDKVPMLESSTAISYLNLFFNMNGKCSAMKKRKIINYVLISLTCLRIRAFSNVCIALAALSLDEQSFPLVELSHACQVPLTDVENCANFMWQLYQKYYSKSSSSTVSNLSWTNFSRRTRQNIYQYKMNRNVILSKCLPLLEEINENEEEIHQEIVNVIKKEVAYDKKEEQEEVKKEKDTFNIKIFETNVFRGTV